MASGKDEINRRNFLKIALAAAAGIGAAGCHVEYPSFNHAEQQILYSSTISDPRTFNPILVTDSASGEVTGRIFDGLVNINPMTTLPESALAQSWDIGDGGRTITFHLLRSIKWPDGKPFTARDVVFSLATIYDPKVPNSIRPSLTVEGKPIIAEAPDDHTVVMRLPKPFAPLLYAIGFPIIPAHVLEPALKAGKFNQTWNINTPPREMVGLGPYDLTRYVPAQMMQFRRNRGYWMRAERGDVLPRLRGQTVLIVQDQNAAYLKFLAGQTDVYSPRPEEVADLLDKAKSLDIDVQKIGIDTGSLFFCFNRNPRHYVRGGRTSPKLKWFTDLNFLRAMAHSVDKQGMINLCFQGLAIPAVSDVSPANKIFHNPNLKDYAYDLKRAAGILESAGYHLARPGVRVDPAGNRLEFDLTTNTGVAIRDQMCAMYLQDLKTLGIKVNYRPLEFTTLVDKLSDSFDWDCVLIGFTGTIEPNNGANFLRSSGNLHLWYPNQKTPATPWEAEIDKLLDEGASVMNIKERAPYYWRIQEILHDQLAVIETVRQIQYDAYRKTLENYRDTVWGMYRPELIQFRES